MLWTHLLPSYVETCSWRYQERSFQNIFFLARSASCLLFVPVVPHSLLSWQPRCTLPCDIVAFSVWIAATVSTKSCLYKPATVTAETTAVATAARKSDSVYLTLSVSSCLNFLLAFAFAFGFNCSPSCGVVILTHHLYSKSQCCFVKWRRSKTVVPYEWSLLSSWKCSLPNSNITER